MCTSFHTRRLYRQVLAIAGTTKYRKRDCSGAGAGGGGGGGGGREAKTDRKFSSAKRRLVEHFNSTHLHSNFLQFNYLGPEHTRARSHDDGAGIKCSNAV